MNRALTTLAAIGLIVGLAAPARAQINEEQMQAPAISADAWINSPPLALDGLRGKVVLVDFWDYTCIGCLRVLPYLRLWNRLYGPMGLVTIGVQTPEFAFAEDPNQVSEAVKRLGIIFPVAVDSGRRIWTAFPNEGLPCEYLIDKDGRVEYSHCGETDNSQFERLIQQMLKQANPKLDFSAARFNPRPDNQAADAKCLDPTPETYLGYLRVENLANPDGYQQLVAASYQPLTKLPLDQFDLSGQWLAMPENVNPAATSAGNYDSLRLNYRAKSVYLVAGTDDGRVIPVAITQDGRSVAPGSRGADMKAEANGQTYLPIGAKRMYYLVENRGFGEHLLDLRLDRPGGWFYAFAFGGNCEASPDGR
jgi:thiol-disulfide isomerase/thioredoxin